MRLLLSMAVLLVGCSGTDVQLGAIRHETEPVSKRLSDMPGLVTTTWRVEHFVENLTIPDPDGMEYRMRGFAELDESVYRDMLTSYALGTIPVEIDHGFFENKYRALPSSWKSGEELSRQYLKDDLTGSLYLHETTSVLYFDFRNR